MHKLLILLLSHTDCSGVAFQPVARFRFDRSRSARDVAIGISIDLLLQPSASGQEQEYERLIEPQVMMDVSTAVEVRRIRSLIEDVVVDRYLSAGEFAKAQPILKLAQIDPLKVEVVLPTDMYGRIHTQTGAEVRPEPPVDGVHRAVVTVVERVIDAASGTFAVELELPNPDYALPAGIGCRTRFDSTD